MSNKPIYRMSEVGYCARALSAKRLGKESEPAPEWLDRAAEEGNWHHDRIRQELRTKEETLVTWEEIEVTLDEPSWSFKIVGHIDGIVRPMSSLKDMDYIGQLLEIKSMSQFEFDRWMRGGFREFPQYADQLTCYMEATGLEEALYIVKNRNSGYEDRRIVKGQPSSFEDIVQKLTGIEYLVESGNLMPAEFDDNSLECRRCAYKALCVPEPKELSPVEEMVLTNATISWRAGKAMEREAQELINQARAILEKHSRATEQKKWKLNGLVINLITINETTTYPKAKLLKVFTEEQLKPASEVKEAYDQLRITDLEKQNGQ